MRQILLVLPSNVSHSFRKSCHVIGQHSEGVSPDCKMCVRVTNTVKQPPLGDIITSGNDKLSYVDMWHK